MDSGLWVKSLVHIDHRWLNGIYLFDSCECAVVRGTIAALTQHELVLKILELRHIF